MLTVIWGIDGFHVVDLMTAQHSYSTQYFPGQILEPLLLAIFPDVRKLHSLQLGLHLDNCRVHRSKAYENFFAENLILRAPNPPYSPDLAPSDFWLFGHLNAALAGQQSLGPDDLLTGVQECLSEIPRSRLKIVFHH
jgi:histone-lysine N-methyltransferase SETMAR